MILAYIILITILFPVVFFEKGRIKLRKENSEFDKYYLIVISILFYLQFALRSNFIGNDTIAYVLLYENLQAIDYTEVMLWIGRFEIGYLYFSKIISDIFTSPQFLFVVSGLIIIPAYSVFIYKYSKLIWLSVFLYFTLRYFDENMNILRQALAICFILYSYSFLRKKRLIRFLICVFLASLFHKSAIVFILAWSINLIRIRNNYFFIFLLGIIVSFIIAPIVTNFLFKYEIVHSYYIDSDYLESGKLGPALSLIVSSLIFLFCLFTRSYKIANFDRKTNEIIYDNNSMLFLQMLGVFILIFNLYFSILGRVAMYFNLFSIILLPNSVKCIRNRNNYILCVSAILVLFIFYYWVIVTFRPDWNKVYPYEFYFSYMF